MDMLLESMPESEPPAEEAELYIDGDLFENERCGICMDIVVDRGVLDCCEHWFCFACIDNWASITNLCPLCKNEFQLITCLPVFDTFGNTTEEHPLPRDDDWCIQGKNNTLSFPSYYIDEDAVTCLDGDGCKIRNGPALGDESLTIDTSIACDSCDVWYHAFCVGFNPQSACENSWLCPRCVTDVASNSAFMCNMGNSELTNRSNDCFFDSSILGKVSISVADTGDTDVVVSIVERTQKKNEGECSPLGNILDVDSGRYQDDFFTDAATTKEEMDLQDGKIGCADSILSNLVYNFDKGVSSNAESFHGRSEVFSDTNMILAEMEGHARETGLEQPFLHDTSFFSSCNEVTNGMETSNPLLHDPTLSCNSVGTPSPSVNSTNNSLESSLAEPLPRGMSLSSYKDEQGDMGLEAGEEFKCDPDTFDGGKISGHVTSGNFDTCKVTSTTSLEASDIDNELSVKSSTINLHLDPSVAPSSVDLATDKMDSSPVEGSVEVISEKNFEGGDAMKECLKRHLSKFVGSGNHDGRVDSNKQGKSKTEHFAKKARSEKKHENFISENPVLPTSDHPSGTPKAPLTPKKDRLNRASNSGGRDVDIMSIVKEVARAPCRPAGVNSSDKTIIGKGNGVAGPRIKKILRRAGDKSEPSILIQNLRKEIKETVEDKTSDLVNKKLLSGELLTAFRAALSRPQEDKVVRPVSSAVALRKTFLQKGKVRGNLVKKIYATSTGRRRKAWDKDFDVEFWKHRCLNTRQGEVETLQSVLEILKKTSSSLNSDMTEVPEKDNTSSILSRVYVADSSVFPRKDDIRPLSTEERENQQQNKKNDCQKSFQFSRGNSNMPSASDASEPLSSFPDDKRSRASALKTEVPNKKAESHGSRASPASIARPSRAQEDASVSKELPEKSDKKRWAMEILARKNALNNMEPGRGDQEDGSLKGNYPLLAQLPANMRPVLASGRNNKVPVSIRQAQLYRIAEHYLRRANLATMCMSAETELALADAVNIEREIFERSNSKSVYVNLCSRVPSQQKMPVEEPKAGSSESVAPVEGSNDTATKPSDDSVIPGSHNVEEALQLAGLCDTPPSSPCRPVTGITGDESTVKEGVENVLEMGSHPEMDIYGDFEYDLEDDGYIASSKNSAGAGNIKAQQADDRDFRIKVLLTGVGDKFSDAKSDVENNGSCEGEVATREASCSSAGGLSCSPAFAEQRSLNVDGGIKPSQQELNLDTSLTEYEELYGPENVLFANTSTAADSRNPLPLPDNGSKVPETDTEGPSVGPDSGASSAMIGNVQDQIVEDTSTKDNAGRCITSKVEAYVKEHIRPLCKSGVISVEQYRWAVGKTTEKVMKFHGGARNANFLVKEGAKVKKLAEEYVAASQRKEWHPCH